MTEKIMLTKAGLKQMEDELENLKEVRRKEVAERLKEAIALGDLSENSEYDDAKNEQAFVEGRIQELTIKLRNVELIPDSSQSDNSTVTIGSRFVVRDLEFNDEMEYTLVGSAEADPENGRISNESPLGQAILYQSVGQVVEVQAPIGKLQYEIVRIVK